MKFAWLYFDEEKRLWLLDNEAAYANGIRAIAFIIPEELDKDTLAAGLPSKSDKSWYPVWKGKPLKRHRDSVHY